MGVDIRDPTYGVTSGHQNAILLVFQWHPPILGTGITEQQCIRSMRPWRLTRNGVFICFLLQWATQPPYTNGLRTGGPVRLDTLPQNCVPGGGGATSAVSPTCTTKPIPIKRWLQSYWSHFEGRKSLETYRLEFVATLREQKFDEEWNDERALAARNMNTYARMWQSVHRRRASYQNAIVNEVSERLSTRLPYPISEGNWRKLHTEMRCAGVVGLQADSRPSTWQQRKCVATDCRIQIIGVSISWCPRHVLFSVC